MGEASTLRIVLRCFADAGLDFAQVANALRIDADAGFAATLIEARLEAVGEDYACYPASPPPPAI